MSRLSRLRNLEVRYRPALERQGSYEVHVIGGWPRLGLGQQCSEHEYCAFNSKPIYGRVRRVITFAYKEGMGNPFEIG